MVGQELQRDYGRDRIEQPRGFGNPKNVVRNFGYEIISVGRHRDHHPTPGFGLLHLADGFLVPGILRAYGDYRHVLIYQRNRTVLHLSRRVSFGVNIGDLLQL